MKRRTKRRWTWKEKEIQTRRERKTEEMEKNKDVFSLNLLSFFISRFLFSFSSSTAFPRHPRTLLSPPLFCRKSTLNTPHKCKSIGSFAFNNRSLVRRARMALALRVLKRTLRERKEKRPQCVATERETEEGNQEEKCSENLQLKREILVDLFGCFE